MDLQKLSTLLILAQGNRSLNEFSRQSKVANSYLSHLINMTEKIKNAPSPDVLRKFALSSEGRVLYVELLMAAGHLNNADIEEFLSIENEVGV